ncbi:unnamed protein product [Allacma fusca]|uniref:Uncharacterized protein n=1 Tax=Allacma fusca TaxID=39272 RepID=A0A8J2P143_9HEXA|nr:unnamed protein product [Allacma fusca]
MRRPRAVVEFQKPGLISSVLALGITYEVTYVNPVVYMVGRFGSTIGLGLPINQEAVTVLSDEALNGTIRVKFKFQST